MIRSELNIPNVLPEVDKEHSVGKVKKQNDKKTQDIIVCFENHLARYEVFSKENYYMQN